MRSQLLLHGFALSKSDEGVSVQEQTLCNLFTSGANHANMEQAQADTICISRSELDREHSNLIARVQQLRRLLGYPPLPTGKEARRQRQE